MQILEHEETHQIFSIFLKQLVKRENKIKRSFINIHWQWKKESRNKMKENEPCKLKV